MIMKRKEEEAAREAMRPRLNDEQAKIISSLVEAHHKTYDASYADFNRFRVSAPSFPSCLSGRRKPGREGGQRVTVGGVKGDGLGAWKMYRAGS